MNQAEHDFLNELDKKLWSAACKLWPVLDAAVYKHVVLGLIFLKYASDAFDHRREELKRRFRVMTGLINLFSTTNFTATEHNGKPLCHDKSLAR
ncbi:MAG: type I restriction-modification system subunit M N-terminal domain-containing protein [Nitrospirae bacterium]|nr:type I restriction-modification system subunit M N-terminal domain-containing protein [Fimbriimonadaceae bacterium]